MKSAIPFALLALPLSLFFSCTKKETAPAVDPPLLRSDKTTIELTPDGTKDSFAVTSNVRWKITKPSTANWLQVSKDSGTAGTATVYVLALANAANTPRSETLLLSAADGSVNPVQVTVKQSAGVKITWFTNYHGIGGATVSIQGRGFSPVAPENNVTFNGKPATVQTATNTFLQVTVPALAGSGPIVVSVNNKADTSSTDFIYDWVGTVTVIAGGTDGYQDGPGSTARFSHPSGLRFDAAGNLYVADYNNSKVRKITTTGMVSTLPGRFAAWNNPSGPNTDYGLPTAVAADAANNILVVEFNSNAVSKLSSAGAVSLLAGGNASGLVNGTGTAASFNRPVDLAIDAAGNLFVADKDNLCIRKITPAGVVSTFAGGTWGYEDGTGAAARFNRPMGIDIDAAGNLYVSDYYNNRIRKVTPAGVVTTVAGTGLHGSMDGDALTQATFTNPYCVAVAPNGIVFVSDADGDNQIRKLNPNGKVETITTFVNAATGGSYQFNGIYGMTVDKNGVLYASDYYNNRICKISYK